MLITPFSSIKSQRISAHVLTAVQLVTAFCNPPPIAPVYPLDEAEAIPA